MTDWYHKVIKKKPKSFNLNLLYLKTRLIIITNIVTLLVICV